jgi:hypothetical protein
MRRFPKSAKRGLRGVLVAGAATGLMLGFAGAPAHASTYCSAGIYFDQIVPALNAPTVVFYSNRQVQAGFFNGQPGSSATNSADIPVSAYSDYNTYQALRGQNRLNAASYIRGWFVETYFC